MTYRGAPRAGWVPVTLGLSTTTSMRVLICCSWVSLLVLEAPRCCPSLTRVHSHAADSRPNI